MDSNFKATHRVVSKDNIYVTFGNGTPIKKSVGGKYWENEAGCVVGLTAINVEAIKPASLFTDAQLSYLEETYGLVRLAAVGASEGATEAVEEPFKVVLEDGIANKESVVWWRAYEGPEQVDLNVRKDHQENIREFPHLYCFHKPAYKIVYE